MTDQTPAVDIVERLRDPRYIGQEAMRQRAADEITRLRARLEVAPGWSEDADGIACRDDTIALQDARIAALQRKLDEAEGLMDEFSNRRTSSEMSFVESTHANFEGLYDRLIEKSRAALSSIRGEG